MCPSPKQERRTQVTSERSYQVRGNFFAAEPIPPGLYITATPIGNLGDVTLRALETLAAADLLACEDTRVTSRLTQHYGISTPLIAYHEHNAERQRPRILAAIGEGSAVALVSDAGTPLISDPGYRLVIDSIAAGHDIIPIPGASAMLAGLVGAGLPTDRFLFAGFLPTKATARRKKLADLSSLTATLIFYEAPRRVAATLADMAATLGRDRQATVARELTKLFETFRRGTLDALAGAFSIEAPPKGEVTIIVGPPPADVPDQVEIDTLLRQRMKQVSLAEAVAEVTTATGAARKLVYRRALAVNAIDDPQ
ncbi:MAG: 16S rRNA (cytidine(1402)-2'-O)-methyltransferase [Alphaproteobacteria bacterium]